MGCLKQLNSLFSRSVCIIFTYSTLVYVSLLFGTVYTLDECCSLKKTCLIYYKIHTMYFFGLFFLAVITLV